MARVPALACAILGLVPAPAREAPPLYRSLTRAFADFADSTAALSVADRVALFRARFHGLFPAFYRPRDGRSPADYDRMIARALLAFPKERPSLEAVERTFATAYAAEAARFRRTFPGFRLASPVYLLHSLGEMDAGTRVIGGRRVLIFGADGIARVDTPDSVPMLLDHEFFHIVHGRTFPGCQAIWCTLWREGMAVYATSILNPGASDRQLGLEEPSRMRPAVEAHRREAFCLLRARLGATDAATRRLFFLSGGGDGPLPPRFGYYLGYRIAQRAGQKRSLAMLTDVRMLPGRALVETIVADMAAEAGGCPAGQSATVSTSSPATVVASIRPPKASSRRSA